MREGERDRQKEREGERLIDTSLDVGGGAVVVVSKDRDYEADAAVSVCLKYTLYMEKKNKNK